MRNIKSEGTCQRVNVRLRTSALGSVCTGRGYCKLHGKADIDKMCDIELMISSLSVRLFLIRSDFSTGRASVNG